jgi:hypothetical protein
MSKTAVRWILYPLPFVAWAIYLIASTRIRSFSEFVYAGHWLLGFLIVFYLAIWRPLVRWLTRE